MEMDAEIANAAQRLLEGARARGLSVATAESCTGGLLGGAITSVSGASDIYGYGFITYANAAKEALLGVPAQLIAAHGAVSEPVALAMAEGARRRSGADLAVSVSGIAGPGGAEHKPEGRVCFALDDAAGSRAETVEFGALGRANVRRAAVLHALKLLIKALPEGE